MCQKYVSGYPVKIQKAFNLNSFTEKKKIAVKLVLLSINLVWVNKSSAGRPGQTSNRLNN